MNLYRYSRVLALKRERPLWTWADCLKAALRELPPVDWTQIGYGAVVVCLGLGILSQAFHRVEDESWICTRSGYAPVFIKGQWVAGAPCLEETHIRTGAVRETDFAKAKASQ